SACSLLQDARSCRARRRGAAAARDTALRGQALARTGTARASARPPAPSATAVKYGPAASTTATVSKSLCRTVATGASDEVLEPARMRQRRTSVAPFQLT